MDFNLIYDNLGVKDANIVDKIKKAFELGYETVAINTIVESEKLKEKNVTIPEPKQISLNGVSNNKKCKILNRLTAVIGDSIHGHHLMQCPTTKRYDIIAVQPADEKMLQHCCATLEVDIISLDLTVNPFYSYKKTYLNQAKQRGLCFEIQYSACLRDQSARRYVISNTQKLVQTLKGKNIIVSSGALNSLEIRGVHDVVNLCNLFSFKGNSAKEAVFTNGQIILSHSGTRLKTGCGFASVEELFRLSKQNKWLVSACRVPRKEEKVTDEKVDCESSSLSPKKKRKKFTQ